MFDKESLRGVFHVHVHLSEEFIECWVVPKEGTDWENTQLFRIPDSGDGSLLEQVELFLLGEGFVATWPWSTSYDSRGTRFIGQFDREGSYKEVRDSRAREISERKHVRRTS